MAIQANVETHGITVEGAYIRVEPRTLNKTMLGFRKIIYADAAQTEPFAVEDLVCPYDMDGENPWKQAYAHLKTLPEFTGAVDC